MMIPVVVLKMVATGVVATLAACSATNMYQTHHLLQSTRITDMRSTGSGTGEEPTAGSTLYDKFGDCTSEQIVATLQGLKRIELLKIFLAAEAPSSIDCIQGSWNGILLDNHSWVMVRHRKCNCDGDGDGDGVSVIPSWITEFSSKAIVRPFFLSW